MNKGSIWRHVKSDRLYVILGQCRIEENNRPAVRYISIDGGYEWVRPEEEFLDGRFVRDK